jgi:FtsZ-interacting cell division protein ZipA
VSQLQFGLLALGALVIASVVFYNWWQERSIRRDMVRRFDGPIDDVLLGKNATAEADSTSSQHTASATVDEEEEYEPEIEDESPDSADSDEFESEWEEPEFTVTEADETEPETEPPLIESEADTDEEDDEESVLLEADEPIMEEEIEPEIAALVKPPAVDETLAEDAEPTAPLPEDLDALIEEIATLSPKTPFSGKEIIESLSFMSDFGKPVRWYGASRGAWMLLTNENAQLKFSRFVAALQLADRSGALQEKGWLEFQNKIKNLGQKIGGGTVWLDDRDTVKYAEALDQFCIDVDVTVTLHLTAGISGPFAGTKLRSLMEASGLTLQQDGRFHFANEEGISVFSISNSDQHPFSEEALRTAQLSDVVLLLDVPRVFDASNVFKQMAMLGNRMEAALNAKLTDARQRTLGEPEIEQIRSQIRAIHAKMQERNLIPGSAPVLRLFS